MSLGLDCMCEKNDPDCAECWDDPVRTIADGYVGAPYIGDVVRSGLKLGTIQEVPSDFDRDVRYRFDECLELLLRKHKDYGPSNIGNAPGGALNGLRVRMHDKISRINNLIDRGKDPKNESLRDSFADLANYSVIALLCIDGVWPSE